MTKFQGSRNNNRKSNKQQPRHMDHGNEITLKIIFGVYLFSTCDPMKISPNEFTTLIEKPAPGEPQSPNRGDRVGLIV